MPKIKLIKTNKKYRPLRYSPRIVYKDKNGKEYVKLQGKLWPKNALEGGDVY